MEFNTDDEERDLVSRHPHSSRNFLCAVMLSNLESKKVIFKSLRENI